MAEKRRKFSSEEEIRILRRHLVDKAPLSDLCHECGLRPTVLYRWQKMFFENGAAAFERRDDGRTRKVENKLCSLQAKLAQKDEVIAEIMAAHVALKKVLARAESIFAERDAKLAAARQKRAARRKQQRREQRDPLKPRLTTGKEMAILASAGETDAGSAGEQPARDSRLGGDGDPSGGVPQLPHPFLTGCPEPPSCLRKLKGPAPAGVA